jgi:hypothetical protein
MTEYQFIKKTRQWTHGRSTMTAEVACQIVEDKFAGMTKKQIATKHGRSVSCVSLIANGYTWVKETADLRAKLAKLKKEAQS